MNVSIKRLGAIYMTKRNAIQLTSVETSSDLDVANLVKEKVECAIKKQVDECSKDYFRNIKVDFAVTIN